MSTANKPVKQEPAGEATQPTSGESSQANTGEKGTTTNTQAVESISRTKTGDLFESKTHEVPSDRSEHNVRIDRMASNTLANLRACVKEFDTEQSGELASTSKRFMSWLENFEACADFEDVSPEKRRPALLALGGEKFRELCKTLDVSNTDTYAQVVEKLKAHYTPQKNLSAERFKFINMRPESSEETHDRWVTAVSSDW